MKLLDWIFPRRCLLCRNFLAEGSVCDGCRFHFPFLKPPCCPVCAQPYEAGEDHLCPRCLEKAPHFMKTIALGRYEKGLADLVHRMKYRGEERIADLLGDWLSEKIHEEIDLILPIPLHARKLKERGFNQAAVIARRIGRRLKVETDCLLLEKRRDTPTQTGLTADERGKNLRDSFFVKREEEVEEKRILLVDDVYTTGATLEACARVLRRSGAVSIIAAVAARTP